MNVVQGLYRDFRLPVFLSEQRISLQPRLNRRPTTEDRLRFGAALAVALWQAVTPSANPAR